VVVREEVYGIARGSRCGSDEHLPHTDRVLDSVTPLHVGVALAVSPLSSPRISLVQIHSAETYMCKIVAQFSFCFLLP
jgi:hypothetical protein